MNSSIPWTRGLRSSLECQCQDEFAPNMKLCNPSWQAGLRQYSAWRKPRIHEIKFRRKINERKKQTEREKDETENTIISLLPHNWLSWALRSPHWVSGFRQNEMIPTPNNGLALQILGAPRKYPGTMEASSVPSGVTWCMMIWFDVELNKDECL